MSTHDYIVRWLVPDDAEQIAALEARVHVSEHRAGGQLIWEQLQAMEGDGRNLSLGLYRDGQLVGFGLAFVMSDRREMASFFDAPLPVELDPLQSTIYIADWVVEPEHRRATKLMAAKFAEIVRQREDLRHLPADAFATTEYADKWCAPNAFFAKLGWTFAGRYPFHDARLSKTLHWLHFNRIARQTRTQPTSVETPVNFVQAPEDWDALRPHWDALLERTPQISPLQSWEYLRTWYAHFGVIEQPFAIVVGSNGAPVAFAPLQIATVWQRGRHCPILTNPALTAEAQVSRVLVAEHDERAMSAIADCMLAHSQSWEAIELNIHCSQPAFANLLKKRLRNRGFPVSTRRGFVEYHIDKGNTRASQSSPAPWRFEISPASGLDMLDHYLDLEHYAPDDEAWQGACASSRHMSFYRALVAQHAQALGVHIGILYSGDERAAGIIGFLWRRQFYVVHVTRPESFAPAHTECIALAKLIEWCFAADACDSIDLTALDDEKWSAWATRTSGSTLLRAYPASLSGWWLHARSALTS